MHLLPPTTHHTTHHPLNAHAAHPQDDSEDPQLEYANRTALQALGFAAFDDATGGMAAAALADARHPASQAEWLWACTEAAERPEQ